MKLLKDIFCNLDKQQTIIIDDNIRKYTSDITGMSDPDADQGISYFCVDMVFAITVRVTNPISDEISKKFSNERSF